MEDIYRLTLTLTRPDGVVETLLDAMGRDVCLLNSVGTRIASQFDAPETFPGLTETRHIPKEQQVGPR